MPHFLLNPKQWLLDHDLSLCASYLDKLDKNLTHRLAAQIVRDASPEELYQIIAKLTPLCFMSNGQTFIREGDGFLAPILLELTLQLCGEELFDFFYENKTLLGYQFPLQLQEIHGLIRAFALKLDSDESYLKVLPSNLAIKLWNPIITEATLDKIKEPAQQLPLFGATQTMMRDITSLKTIFDDNCSKEMVLSEPQHARQAQESRDLLAQQCADLVLLEGKEPDPSFEEARMILALDTAMASNGLFAKKKTDEDIITLMKTRVWESYRSDPERCLASIRSYMQQDCKHEREQKLFTQALSSLFGEAPNLSLNEQYHSLQEVRIKVLSLLSVGYHSASWSIANQAPCLILSEEDKFAYQQSAATSPRSAELCQALSNQAQQFVFARKRKNSAQSIIDGLAKKISQHSEGATLDWLDGYNGSTLIDGHPLLSIACTHGKVEIVDRFLGQSFDIDTKDGRGNTALVLCLLKALHVIEMQKPKAELSHQACTWLRLAEKLVTHGASLDEVNDDNVCARHLLQEVYPRTQSSDTYLDQVPTLKGYTFPAPVI